MTYELELSKEQAETTCQALDLYARVLNGQLDEVARVLEFIPGRKQGRSEEARVLLALAKLALIPELSVNAHFGITGGSDEAKVAYDVYQVIRHRLAWDKNPQGGFQVEYDKPLYCSGKEPAVIRKKDVEQERDKQSH